MIDQRLHFEPAKHLIALRAIRCTSLISRVACVVLAGGSVSAVGAQAPSGPIAPPVSAQAGGASLGGARVAAAAPTENVVAFPRAFFAPFRPATALDMINRVPGFTFLRGDGGVRGLQGAAGNVLIDGQRPVTKSLSLDEVIRRLPAAVVLRIELIRGGAAGIDMQGQSLVANIVRDPRGFLTVAAELQGKVYRHDPPAANPRVEGTWSRGDWSASAAVAWRDEREQGHAGVGPITRVDLVNPANSGSGRYVADWDRTEASGNATLEYRGSPHTVRLNLSASREGERNRDRVNLTNAAGITSDELIDDDAMETSGEATLDYENVLSNKVIGRVMLLQRLEGENNRSLSFGRGQPQNSTERNLEGETVARLQATIVPRPKLTIEASAEGTYNFLDARSRLFVNGTPVALPSAQVRVSETRGNFTAFARLQTGFGSVEAGSGYELSTIRQSGDADQAKNLSFLKPRALATIDPVRDWQVRLRAERLVGQLNFGDFAANIQLDPGGVNAGNPDLVPETSWLAEATIERRFWGRGALVLTGSQSWLSNAIDLVPIGGRFDAPGNIGGGWRQELRTSLTVPFERLGLGGGQVRLNGTWRRSRVTDPVTGLRRRISRQRPFAGDLLVTKDLPAIKSSLNLELFAGFEELSNRLFELRTERSTMDPLGKVYLDWSPSSRTLVRFQVENVPTRTRSRRRIYFSGPRSAGKVSGSEYREATLDTFLMVRIRRQF